MAWNRASAPLASVDSMLAIPARSVVVIRLAVSSDAAPTPGEYSGFLIVTGKGCGAQRQVLLTVQPPHEPALRLIAWSWTIAAVRLWPYPVKHRVPIDFESSAFVPLEDPVDTAAIRARGAVLATALSSPDGASMTAHWNDSVMAVSPGAAALPLTFTGEWRPGDYSGAVDILGTGPDGRVQLRLRVTDWWPYPVVTIFVGVLLAYVCRRWIGVRRPYLLLKRKVLSVERAFDESQRAFDQALRRGYGPDFSKGIAWSVTDDFHARLRSTDALLNEFATLDPDDAALGEVRKRLGELEDAVRAWQGIGDALTVLANLRSDVLGLEAMLTVSLPPGGAWRPQILGPIDQVSVGRVVTIPDLADGRDEIQRATFFVSDWRREVDSVSELRHWTEEAVSIPGVDPQALAAATLCVAAAASALYDLSKREELQTLEGEITKCRTTVRDVFPKNAVVEPIARAAATPIRVAPRKRAPKQLGRRILAISRYVSLSDKVILAVSLVVATVTGLEALYVGKSFGTWPDYLTALLWGFGTKIGVEALTTAFGRIVAEAT
jgi:hypothetical protein